MPYITIAVKPKEYQVSFDDILNGIDESVFEDESRKHAGDTRTVYRDILPDKIRKDFNVEPLIRKLRYFNADYATLAHKQREKLYNTFYTKKRSVTFYDFVNAILKTRKQRGNSKRIDHKAINHKLYDLTCEFIASHPTDKDTEIKQNTIKNCINYLSPLGFKINEDKFWEIFKSHYRRIDAPKDDLKEAIDSLVSIFKGKFYTGVHNSAHAYVKQRCNITNALKHCANDSRWYLHLDMKNFFGSFDMPFIMNMIQHVFPFSEVVKYDEGKKELEQALELCTLGGVLPQGTPISPMLTNIVMVPLDHYIGKVCSKRNIVYTRYADDMEFSCQYSFMWTTFRDELKQIFTRFGAPLAINDKKTHYGNRAGKNFVLGLMINNNNQITVGHRRKHDLKLDLYNFVIDCSNGEVWDYKRVQRLAGLISYYRNVEKKNIDSIINNYNKKFNINIEKIIKNILQ